MGLFYSKPKPQPAPAKLPMKYYRGLFFTRSGRNILEEAKPTIPLQWVTVFFDWPDRAHDDANLMLCVIAKIRAGKGLIAPEPMHHDQRWCMSFRVPSHYNAADTSIAAIAVTIAFWHRDQILNHGHYIDRRYVFRMTNHPRWGV